VTVPERIFEQTLASFFEPIRTLVDDPSVDGVLVNRHDEIYVEKKGLLERSEHEFTSEDALMAALRNLSQYVGRTLTSEHPILEARLPNGSRVEAVVPPASPGGAILSIRCPRETPLRLDDMRRAGSLCVEEVELLRSMVASRKNILIGGGSGCGKTVLLNACVSEARVTDRVIVIEGSSELRLGLPHVIRLEARPPDPSGRGAITVQQLVRVGMRMRPDRIVIGEVRGEEALDLVHAMTSGHRGCLSTIHATLPMDALRRLETLTLMGDRAIPIDVVREQVASAIDVLLVLAREESGARRLTHVAEVRGVNGDGEYELRHHVSNGSPS
jgi:pilus assembly protein CpaF